MVMKDKDFPDNYVPVSERIKKFREKYPDGLITTVRTETEAGVSFKAVVYRNPEEAKQLAPNGIAVAVGHSFLLTSEAEEATKVEEATETAAIGRALAVLGFEIQNGIASEEEMEVFTKNKTRFQKAEPKEEEESSEEENEEEDQPEEQVEEKPKTTTKLKSSRFQRRFVKPESNNQ